MIRSKLMSLVCRKAKPVDESLPFPFRRRCEAPTTDDDKQHLKEQLHQYAKAYPFLIFPRNAFFAVYAFFLTQNQDLARLATNFDMSESSLLAFLRLTLDTFKSHERTRLDVEEKLFITDVYVSTTTRSPQQIKEIAIREGVSNYKKVLREARDDILILLTEERRRRLRLMDLK